MDSLPFGDGVTVNGLQQDTGYFAGNQYDLNTHTNLAQFRQYSEAQGRWLSPDPYSGSYDFTNPQTLNRYAYVGNNPLSFSDPSGLDDNGPCPPDDPCPSDGGGLGRFFAAVGAAIAAALGALFGFGGPSFHGSLQPRPNASGGYTMSVTGYGTPYPTFNSGGLGFGISAAAALGCPLGAFSLTAPGGIYNVRPPAVATFQPRMADELTSAIQSLNSQGITPTINSGFRTAADQLRMRLGGSGVNPAASVSWHQVGMAVDINGTADPSFTAIVSAMRTQGLTWGGTFRNRDLPHFQMPRAGTSPSAAMVRLCGVGG